MTQVRMELTGDIDAGLDKLLANVDDKVLVSGVAASARIFYDDAKVNASKHFKTGTLYSAIYRVYSKQRSAPGRIVYEVSWNHRRAPHGHLIEFGTSRAPAYPFIRPAFDRAQDAVDAGKARMSAVLAGGV